MTDHTTTNDSDENFDLHDVDDERLNQVLNWYTVVNLTEDKAKKIIPNGIYCYDENGPCPFWDKSLRHEHQQSGFCHWLQEGDWELNGSLLWDQCKECGINLEENN